jgi:hypothetical protein
MEGQMSEEYERGVQDERKRIEKILYKYRAEGLESVHVRDEPGVRFNAIRRFDTSELIDRIWPAEEGI